MALGSSHETPCLELSNPICVLFLVQCCSDTWYLKQVWIENIPETKSDMDMIEGLHTITVEDRSLIEGSVSRLARGLRALGSCSRGKFLKSGKIGSAESVCLLTLGLMLVLGTFAGLPPVHATAADVEFYVDPCTNSFTGDTSARFNVTAMWKDTGTPLNKVFAWQISLYYTSTLLNCTRAWQPVWDTDYIFYNMTTVRPPAGFFVGYVQAMDVLYRNSSAVGDLRKLAIFEMDIMYIPPQGVTVSSALNINNVDTFWSPDGLNWNDPVKTDGICLFSSAWTPPLLPPAPLNSAITDCSPPPSANITADVKTDSQVSCSNASRYAGSYDQVVYAAFKYETSGLPLIWFAPEELGIIEVTRMGATDLAIVVDTAKEPFPLQEKTPIFRYEGEFYEVSSRWVTFLPESMEFWKILLDGALGAGLVFAMMVFIERKERAR